jgi:ApbE superfamily uncharacterized protein (UPF0280 family)
LAEVAIAGIAAGVELVLLAAPQADAIATALAEAVQSGRIRREKLERAAAAVRRLAQEMN